jgi:hypothetical protein
MVTPHVGVLALVLELVRVLVRVLVVTLVLALVLVLVLVLVQVLPSVAGVPVLAPAKVRRPCCLPPRLIRSPTRWLLPGWPTLARPPLRAPSVAPYCAPFPP